MNCTQKQFLIGSGASNACHTDLGICENITLQRQLINDYVERLSKTYPTPNWPQSMIGNNGKSYYSFKGQQ